MSCYCLCATNHPDHPGICTGEATGKLRFSDFPEESILAIRDYVDVPMCRPCREKTLATKREIDG